MIAALGLAGTLFLGIFSCLLEEFLELSGYHGHFVHHLNLSHHLPKPLK